MSKKFIFTMLALGTFFLVLAVADLSAKASAKKGSSAPEIIVMDKLVNLYEPVAFTHEIHIEIVGNCTDCHHHGKTISHTGPCGDCHQTSVETIGDSSCGICHETALAVNSAIAVPLLKGAYHKQCFPCHYEPGSAVGGCTDTCHAERKN